MAIKAVKRLIEDLENNTDQVISDVTKLASTATVAGSAAYAGTAYLASSAAYAGTAYLASSAAFAGTASTTG